MKRYSLDDLQTRLDFEKGNYGKNYIINGGFDRWDYATSQTSSGYGSDNRWSNANSGSTKTHSQVASGDVERALFNSSKFSRTVVTSVIGVSNQASKWQHIENVTKFAGKTVTISFWARADSNKNIAIELGQVFGTGGTPSSTVPNVSAQLVALTSNWQRKSITVTIPSIVGKTLGTDGMHTTSTYLDFWFDAGSDYNTRAANLGQQSGTFDIAEVQLEEGSVATPWTPYSGEFGGEVQACARYYQTDVVSGLFVNYAINIGATQSHKLSTTMRVTPTLSISAFTAYVFSSISLNGYISNSTSAFSCLLNNAQAASTVGAIGFTYTASAEL